MTQFREQSRLSMQRLRNSAKIQLAIPISIIEFQAGFSKDTSVLTFLDIIHTSHIFTIGDKHYRAVWGCGARIDFLVDNKTIELLNKQRAIELEKDDGQKKQLGIARGLVTLAQSNLDFNAELLGVRDEKANSKLSNVLLGVTDDEGLISRLNDFSEAINKNSIEKMPVLLWVEEM